MEPAAFWAAVAVVIFAGASFFFALAETARFSLGKWQARQLAEQNPRGGIVARLLARPEDLLAAMVLGHTFATAAMLAVGLWLALHERSSLLPIFAGLLALILAWIQHRQELRSLKVEYGPMRYSIASIVAAMIAGLGVMALLGVTLRM